MAIALRHRGQKLSKASPSPDYGDSIRRSASTEGVGNDNSLGGGVIDDRSWPRPPPRPFHRSTTSPIGPYNPTGGVTLDDSMSSLPLSYVPARSDHDQGGAAGAITEESPSSAPRPPWRANSEGEMRSPPPFSGDGIPPTPWKALGRSHNNGRKRHLLVLHLIALSTLSCAALYLRGAMTTVEAELDAAREGHKRRVRNEAVAKEKGELEAEIGALHLRIRQHESAHPELLLDQQWHGLTLESLNTQHLELHKVVTHTTNLVSDASGEREKYRAMVDGVEELGEYMKSRETELWRRIEGLESRIGRESYRESLEW